MPTFTSYDGTPLGYRVLPGPGPAGGPDLVCLPGGPMLDSAYLGDLGGLAAHRRLVLLDPRGTGSSAVPEDPATYRCDRQVDDVEALRRHLGLDRMDLLAHSAGANLAALYAARHPQHTGRLALITPSVAATGITVSGEQRLAAARLRRDEPWFPAAFAALERIVAGRAGADDWTAAEPFFHGRWDAAARRFAADGESRKNQEAAAAFGGDGAYDPAALRAALGRFEPPVLVLAGELDLQGPLPVMTQYAGLFKDARLTVRPGAGHFPWRDDPAAFASAVAEFLAAG
ncbi:alpha/beta hydrolase [Streptomyces sp. BR123]|uniref:alpha/beta fold hydrolase n=1 Tax=Streptomyces sp. BR123 TaxID=2749828 RepID=UPI0015C469E1|nr:alpha/beta hydrolase [Streptomyces sp. BR123]NXY94066.1 alpha/beta hydrolase [Streptomyces sp. BR123]